MALTRIEPHFSVCEGTACLLFEWRNGDKTLAVWEDKDPDERLYHGLSSDEDREFTSMYEAYAWLVAPPATDEGGDDGEA